MSGLKNEVYLSVSRSLVDVSIFCVRFIDVTTYFLQMRVFLIMCLVALITSTSLTHAWHYRSTEGGQHDVNANKIRDMLGFEERYASHRETSNGHKSARLHSQLTGKHRKQTQTA